MQIEYEHNDAISKKFSSMVDQGKNGFWKEVKRSKRDKMSEWISIKDTNGDRILDPERQKERIASYYEDLYSFDPNLEGQSPCIR